MAKVDGIDKEAAQKLMARWRKVEADAASAVGTIGAETKDKKDTILEAVERTLKVAPKSFRKLMKKDKLLREAEKVRENISDESILAEFDSLVVAADLPLFEFGGLDAPKAKRSRKKAIDESENVTEFRSAETA